MKYTWKEFLNKVAKEQTEFDEETYKEVVYKTFGKVREVLDKIQFSVVHFKSAFSLQPLTNRPERWLDKTLKFLESGDDLLLNNLDHNANVVKTLKPELYDEKFAERVSRVKKRYGIG
jgi:hypothetical protein